MRPYVELLRGNRNLRRIWIADIASMFGDWFNMVAVYTLVEELTGSPMALGWVFITKLLAFALVSPFAGLLADRVDRRRLMIACDLVRAAVMLGFLLIDDDRVQPGLPRLPLAAAVGLSGDHLHRRLRVRKHLGVVVERALKHLLIRLDHLLKMALVSGPANR